MELTDGALNNGVNYRIYKSASITISSTVGDITDIEFTCTANNTSQYGPGCFTLTTTQGTYTYSGKIGTWTGSANSVTFDANSNQVRATKIVVTTSPKKKTTTTFGTDVDNKTFTITAGDEFPKYTATTTDPSGNAVAGTVAYTSDNACVTVDANGQTAAGKGIGTAKITATFTPTEADKYFSSSASYTLEVIDPNVIDVTFDFSTMGYTNAQVVTDVEVEGVKIKLTKGGSNEPKFYTNDNTLRIYKDGGTMTIIAPEGKVITKIVISGEDKYLKNIDEYPTGTWEGSLKEVIATATGTVRMNSIVVTITDQSYDYVWNDTEANDIQLEEGKTVKINRTVVKDEYNTICLPFEMTAEEIAKAFGEGTKVYSFGIAEDNTLMFEEATEMYALTPYLLRPTENKSEIVYTGDIWGDEVQKATSDGYSFIGTLNPAELKIDGTNLFFVAGAKLAKPESDQNNANKLKGFRAYMEVPAASANILNVSIGGMTTSINDIKTDMVVSDGRVYNLSGQYVGNSMQKLAKGVYVMNGKKYVVE